MLDLDEVKHFVQKSFEQNAENKNVEHFERTVYWTKQLKPNADEVILIAAYAHDIARAFRGRTLKDTLQNHEWNDPEILQEHQTKGAKIMTEFLTKKGFEKDKIERIANMILKHEFGGDEESNLIKDADSISYLEINVLQHIKKLVVVFNKNKIKRKTDWMFERISSENAKQIAKPFYKEAIKVLKST
ncbi:MAG: DUF4202 family protein [Patescibacteria group bacterium]